MNGIVYICTHHTSYMRQLKRSLRSLREYMPDIPVTVYTDADVELNADIVPVEFSSEIWRDRIELLGRFPYGRNLYMDADKHVLRDLSPMFELLDRFHLSVAHAACRRAATNDSNIDTPDIFPEHNAAAILYRESSETRAFLDNWLRAFDEHKERFPKSVTNKSGRVYHRDQSPMATALWRTDELNYYVMQPELNCINHCGYLWGEAYMAQEARAYGRAKPEKSATFLNQVTNRARVYIRDRMYVW